MSQNYTDTNTHLVLNDMTETQFSNLQSVDPDQLYLTEDESANQDLSNLTNDGRIAGSGLGMPSNTYIDLTLGTSGTTYTAPANGWFFLQKVAGASNKFITLVNTSLGNFGSESLALDSGNWIKCILPVKKNDVVMAEYSAAGVTKFFRFYYAKGSESEAS